MNLEFQCSCGYWVKLTNEFPTVRCVGCNTTYATGDSFDSSGPGGSSLSDVVDTEGDENGS